ncbi:SusD/RagB family nutrient-binding outer membrane lipoprotein [Chondrinema litorale]|uniref:SusD/RagB family nutrient-binding outer membrane lipoprotein n=1 Tax=Chondrinema litorale TaxID=2994555 RepID=UPI0025439BC9|nr:SusD/RagB family nutrient-binding outer membrane lipoprotein [Chondrinema litorale]UZR93383.1 SusD/RagB family nutrient-binding outer membrane lipoprotein [Chondrinema litorale]
MKNIKIYILSFLILFVSFACDETLDINEDPLAATSADPNAVLPFVIVQYSARKTTELGTRTMDVPQHLSSCFNSPASGPTTSFLTGNTWGMYYTQVLGNLELVEADAREAGETSNNVTAIAVILKALAYYELACIWEDIPFSQAINGSEFQTPEFDTQENVFNGVVAMLDDAMSLIDAIPAEGVFSVSTGDMIYEGDMSLWRKFANSLKIRVLMLIRNQDTSVDSQLVAALSQPYISSNAEVAMLEYNGQSGQENAWFQLVTAFFGPDNESTGTHVPGEIFYNILKDNADPRYDLFIYDPDDVGPAPQGEGAGSFGAYAALTNNVIRGDLPDIWFLPAEITFYRAELALKGVTSDDAQEMYEMGVSQILEFWGGVVPGAVMTLSATEITDYIATLPDLSSLSNDDALTAIYEQQYLETFLRPIVAWNHIRRTKTPLVPPPPGAAISTHLKRFTYPPDEIGANPNTPIDKDTDIAVWFEN